MSEQKNSAVNFPGNQSINALLLESVLNHTTDAVVVTNLSDEITTWNAMAEKLFGYGSNEAIGQSITLILDRETLLRFRAMRGEPDSIACRHSNGTSIPVSMRFDEIIDSDNNLLAFCYFFLDLREKVKQQESLKEKERALESFMYSVSHDLRAPLRRIVNYAEILEEDHLASLDEEVQRLVTRMSKNAEKMGDLINDLLSYSRVSQQPVKKSIVDVHALVTDLVAELKSSPDKARITFSIQPVSDGEADLAMLKRVFENLLSNAIKFTAKKDNPTIEIGSEPGPHTTHYYVKDNGVGFDPQYAYKLFNIFQRLHNPTEYEGTGIGLAIVHQIISRHGGKVWAEGKINEGATFWFSL